jgi:hypothetical protein
MSQPKELDFFIDEDEAIAPGGNWSRGIAWYCARFADDRAVRGEASPNYTAYPLARGVAERAAEVVPQARIIYMVRDPIDRIVSHYLHRRATAGERRSLDEVVDHSLASGELEPARGLLYRSMYALQLERWLRAFGEARVLIVEQESLRQDRLEELRRVFRFLGIDASFASPEFDDMLHVTGEKRPPGRVEAWLARRRAAPGTAAPAAGALTSPAAPAPPPVVSDAHRQRLGTVLASDAERLRNLTGASFSRWSV